MPSHSGERIFISYSHQDKKYLVRLKEILAPGIRHRNICDWDDGKIRTGDNWRAEIVKELSSATIALLLVSDHYLASDFIVNEEFRRILDRAKNDGLRVAWMLLRPCLWKESKIEEYQALHDTKNPLSELPPNKRKEELIKICEQIVEMVDPPASPSLIKGWYPYKYEDKAIFADLQRQGFIESCALGICHEDFRLGLLQGESGVGKTSILQAGLRSRLEELGYDCKYIDLRNDPPPLLQELTPQRRKPLVLLLDHFEKAPIQPQDAFYQALVSWYRNTSIPPIKILASMETNFVGVMQQLFIDIEFTYHPQQCFLLSKLSREEAAKIVRLMAKREGIPFEPGFEDRLIEKSGSNAKEEVSPVVLQITAYTIRKRRQSDGECAFTTRAIEKMGGIEGIYEYVLEEQLQQLDLLGCRHIAEQILKALIDWNKGTRTGALTREEIKNKIHASQTAQKLDTTLERLCTCRIIRKSHRSGSDAYELDQDWVMRVVMYREAEYIGQVRKAERLLTQGYESWREKRENHDLLSPSALERIEPYQQQLGLDADKRDFIAQSRKSVRKKKRDMLVIGGVIALVLVLAVFILYPQLFRPLKYAQSELLELSKLETMKPETRSQIAKALFFVKDFESAQKVIAQMDDNWDKDMARSEIVTSALSTDGSFRKEIKILAEEIKDRRERSLTKDLLKKIEDKYDNASKYFTKDQHSINQAKLIASAVKHAEQEIDPIEKLDVMAAVVQAATHRAETSGSSLPGEEAQAVRKEMEQQLGKIKSGSDEDFHIFQGRLSAAEIAAYLNDGKRAYEILHEANEFTGQISDAHERTLAMRSIAIAAAHFALLMVQDCQTSTCKLELVNDFIKLATDAKDAITEDGVKYAPLSSIVEAQVARAHYLKSPEDLKKARETAKEIYAKAHLSTALRLIVAEMVRLGHEREAVEIAEPNDTDVKADLLASILLTSTEKIYSLQGKNHRSPRLPQEAMGDMIKIDAGPFTMGYVKTGSAKGAREETPSHIVYVAGFSLDPSETTVELYDQFLNETGRKQKPGNWKDKVPSEDREKPVVGITWGDANAYCRWRQKRLPTEAEWEKAARGTHKGKYPWGNSHENGNKPANYDQPDRGDDPYPVLTEVGSFKNKGGDSPYGIHDMAGNAWEWVEDWYDASAYASIHYPGYPASSLGDYKILRGGAWDNNDKDDRLRSTVRLARDPKDNYKTYGFRCARSIEAPLDDASQLPSQGNF